MCVQNDELSVLGMAPGGSGDETSSQTADGRPERVQFVRAHPTDVDLSDIDLSDIDLSHIWHVYTLDGIEDLILACVWIQEGLPGVDDGEMVGYIYIYILALDRSLE